MLNIVLPTGRPGKQIYQIFQNAGYGFDDVFGDSRKLVFTDEKRQIRLFLVKPSDVPIYVEQGVADIGVAGKDVLTEQTPDVYELLDLKAGLCRMAAAARAGFTENTLRPLRVATKYVNTAAAFYRSKGREIEIFKLSGSVEIAPLLGLSDIIVDIVETGSTLRENGLCVIEEIFPVSARLIANKSAYIFKSEQITRAVARLKGGIDSDK